MDNFLKINIKERMKDENNTQNITKKKMKDKNTTQNIKNKKH